ncbi:hypothetical protein TeGR_g8285, partial [Tetraparma gracilis]
AIPDSLPYTLSVLLKLGFEPNERDQHGNTPLSILTETAAALPPSSPSIQAVLRESAELLVRAGARVDLPPFAAAAPTSQGMLFPGMKGDIKLSERPDLIAVLGGAAALQDAAASFKAAPTLPFRSLPTVTKLSDKEKNADTKKADADACKLCRSKFGMLNNRKHLCNFSKVWVCDTCSTKRYADENGEDVRVSDGAYNRGKSEAGVMEVRQKEAMAEREEREIK